MPNCSASAIRNESEPIRACKTKIDHYAESSCVYCLWVPRCGRAEIVWNIVAQEFSKLGKARC